MKILLATGIYPPEIGGPAGYVQSVARELQHRGHVPVVVTYGDEKTLRDDGWRVVAIPRNGGALMRYVRYAFAVRREAKDADVVFLQGPVSEGLPGTIGAMLAGKPTYMKVVGDYAWEMHQQIPGIPHEQLDDFVQRKHSGKIGLLEFLESWTARRATSVIVPSAYLKKIVRTWNVPDSRIRVIYNSIQPLAETVARERLRAKFEVQDHRVILTAVRAVPWKGVDFLLRVLVTLPVEYVLAVAGDGPSLEEWKLLAERLHVSDRVRFLGRLDRTTLAEWYAAADRFALASSYEGFPHVVVEAVSAGLPCVVSDKGGNPETKELFPDRVTVCAFENEHAWRDAFLAPAERTEQGVRRSFVDVVDETLRVFEET